MRDFAQLYAELDASTATQDKVAALVAYFDRCAARGPAGAADAAWAVHFLSGARPRSGVPTALLRATACQAAGVDDWLFEESYQAVGDLAETIALILPAPQAEASALGLAHWIEQRLLPLRGAPPDEQAAQLRAWWQELDTAGRFLLVKLLGGGFRVGVSKLLVQRALARHAGLDPKVIAQRMMGWGSTQRPPGAEAYRALVDPAPEAGRDAGQPYPFFLAQALEAGSAADGEEGGQEDGEGAGEGHGAPSLTARTAGASLGLDALAQRLGPRADWFAEWKYDGIRAQAVKRAGGLWLWSRGEELITERFPEVVARLQSLPDGTVLDGELLAWRDGQPAPFQLLQQRITRKTLTRRILAEAPVDFIAYDLLEVDHQDLRPLPQAERRARLEVLAQAQGVALSPLVQGPDWAALAAARAGARERGVEGLMLKHRASPYGSGRSKAEGQWWKWKIAPMTIDGVLIYAQAGHGRRAGVYTDYSFAVWNRAPRDAAEAQAVVEAIARREPPVEGALQLVGFTKAYSGLTDAEFKAVDKVIRATTLEKFGPVRSLRPTLVFELAFEGIQRSARHKSGIALRFPRLVRLRPDKPLHEADTLQTLEALLQGFGPGGGPAAV